MCDFWHVISLFGLRFSIPKSVGADDLQVPYPGLCRLRPGAFTGQGGFPAAMTVSQRKQDPHLIISHEGSCSPGTRGVLSSYPGQESGH